jgi:hypothetical protein
MEYTIAYLHFAGGWGWSSAAMEAADTAVESHCHCERAKQSSSCLVGAIQTPGPLRRPGAGVSCRAPHFGLSREKWKIRKRDMQQDLDNPFRVIG